MDPTFIAGYEQEHWLWGARKTQKKITNQVVYIAVIKND